MDVEQGSGAGGFGAGDAADASASGSLVALAARLSDPHALAGTRDGLTELVALGQELVNAATAVQDAAIARLAAVESDWAEDGTLVDVVRRPGFIAIDTADLVAPAIGSSHAQAQRRVDLAVRLAAGRVPQVDDARSVPEPTGLRGLHDAMREGRLDGYRAGVVAHELTEAPAEVAGTVVAALDGHLRREPAPALRRRCRRLLARISPDLLRQRTERARSECGLRRWVSEPGVDAWWGTFPSEDAAAAWAAIDDLARRYVADGVCTGLDRARAKALTDLVAAHSTVTVAVTLTVPAGSAAAAAPTTTGVAPVGRGDDLVEVRGLRPAESSLVGRGDDLVEVRGLRPAESSLVSRAWLEGHLASAEVTVECDPSTGALTDQTSTTAYRPTEAMAALVRARDGRCRFPGCSVAARFCDLDHVRPWPAGPTSPENLATLCRRHHRIKQRPGWRVRMATGAVLEWTDPLGRVRTTAPVDALTALVLPAPVDSPAPADAPTAVPVARGPAIDRFSHLEFDLEHRGPRDRPPRRHQVEFCRTPAHTTVHVGGGRPGPHRRAPAGRRRSRWPDAPPF